MCIRDSASFEALVDAQTAAIFVETIQGESGVHAATPEFLRGLRAVCDRHQLLLLIDEVQCGIGRTGKFLACEHAGIQPDAVGLAKGLGGGFPIGAVWISSKFAPLFTPGSHGNTFGGNPLACAAALAVLEVMDHEKPVSYTHLDVYKRQPLSDLTVSGAMDYESQYIFRGKKVTNGAFQPSVQFGYPVYGGSIYVGAWTSQPLGHAGGGKAAIPGPNQHNEIDLFGGYTCLLYTSRCV